MTEAVFARVVVFQDIPAMGEKFHGSFRELQDKLAPLGLDGDWIDLPHGVHKITTREKAGLLWSETKGTIWFDGPTPAKSALERQVSAHFGSGSTAEVDPGAQIFVVHGRDHDSRDQLELILTRLGLTPFVLEVTGGGGDTLIEALEKQIGKMGKCKFGIVLATPDDMGYLEKDGPAEAKPRARQNVIMEMGMLLASLTRKHCAILHKDTLSFLPTWLALSPFHLTITSKRLCLSWCNDSRTQDLSLTLGRLAARVRKSALI